MIISQLVFFFILGYVFKVYFSYEEQTGQMLSRLILYVTLPASIFLTTSNTKLVADTLLLPVVALLLQLGMALIFLLTAKKLQLQKNTECVFVTSPLISNTLFFLAPFFYLAYGDEGLTRLILFDIGNAVTIYFIAQTMFLSYGQKKFNFIASGKMILSSLPLWASFTGFLLGGLGFTIPELVVQPLTILKEANVFLPMFLLGFYFRPALEKIRLVLFTVFFRMLLGLGLGLIISSAFSNPMDKIAIIMGASAPIGLLSVIFSSEHGQDTRFSSSVVSFSMLLGLVVILVLDTIFKYYGLI